MSRTDSKERYFVSIDRHVLGGTERQASELVDVLRVDSSCRNPRRSCLKYVLSELMQDIQPSASDAALFLKSSTA
jgi:hypothetical protein